MLLVLLDPFRAYPLKLAFFFYIYIFKNYAVHAQKLRQLSICIVPHAPVLALCMSLSYITRAQELCYTYPRIMLREVTLYMLKSYVMPCVQELHGKQRATLQLN